MLLQISIRTKKFLADGAYDAYETRLCAIRKLKAIPFTALNSRNCKCNTAEEKIEMVQKDQIQMALQELPEEMVDRS